MASPVFTDLEVTLRPETEGTDRWGFVVYDPSSNRAYHCEVDAKLARDSRLSEWWASRGNAGMARAEAIAWAEGEARVMAISAFRSTLSVQRPSATAGEPGQP